MFNCLIDHDPTIDVEWLNIFLLGIVNYDRWCLDHKQVDKKSKWNLHRFKQGIQMDVIKTSKWIHQGTSIGWWTEPFIRYWFLSRHVMSQYLYCYRFGRKLFALFLKVTCQHLGFFIFRNGKGKSIMNIFIFRMKVNFSIPTWNFLPLHLF